MSLSKGRRVNILRDLEFLFIILSLNIARGQNKLKFKSTANSPCSSPLWESTHAVWALISATCLLSHTGVLRKSYSCFDAGSGSHIIRCVNNVCVKRFNISEDSLSDQEIDRITYLSGSVQTRT